jgi:hypothetical protein
MRWGPNEGTAPGQNANGLLPVLLDVFRLRDATPAQGGELLRVLLARHGPVSSYAREELLKETPLGNRAKGDRNVHGK